jgi:hypothetical protein
MDYTKNYYSILGVNEKATPEELRAAYRHLAHLWHPDKNPDKPLAEERIKEINEAYKVLSNMITRQIYDGYRDQNRQTNHQPGHANTNGNTFTQEPVTKTKTKTYTVTREKKIYVGGIIEVKFQGEPELVNSYALKWEQQFTIFPTEVLVTLTSSNIYKNAPPADFQAGYSTADLFATPLKQPINCRVQTGDQVEFYELDLYDIRVKDPILKDITKHGECSFGTLEGQLFGYVLYQYDETVTEQYTEYAGPTGQVETREESGTVFLRQQFYAPQGGTMWTEWKRKTGYETKERSTSSSTAEKGYPKTPTRHSEVSWLIWLIILIVLIVIWPPLLYAILFIIGWMLLLFLVSWITTGFRKLLPVISLVLIGSIIAFAIRSYSHKADRPYRKPPGTGRISTTKTVVHNREKQADSLITHTIHWQDRDSSQYEINISVPLSALRWSTAAHGQMEEKEYALQGMGAVYRSMLDTDQAYLEPIAMAFDSLAKSRSLNKQQEASMIVSCIQSIPYALVVDKSCTASYSDDYVNQMLAQCETDCCKGYSKFGVQSPVEFIADLKGDCDTRALLLYALLGRLNYNVALMTSNYYKHALIAVTLDQEVTDKVVAAQIKGKPYYMWETTAPGFGPGKIPEAISNLNHWQIALIQ